MLKAIHEWTGLVAVVSIVSWLVIPGKRIEGRRFWRTPIPPRAGNMVHDTLGALFGVSWLAFVATLFSDAWILVATFLGIGLAVLIFELRQ